MRENLTKKGKIGVDGNDFAIDEETVDLFALMNSTVVELQMELELLKSKEYEDYGNGSDHSNNDEEAIACGMDGTDDHGEGSTERSTSLLVSKKDHLRVSPSTPIDATTTATLSTFISSEDKAGAGDSDSDGDDVLDAVDDASDSTTAVVWQPMQPARPDDEDFTPVADYAAAPAVALEPARAGDDDYAPVSDFTSVRRPEVVVATTLEPARIGDDDYSPVSDFTRTAVNETARTPASVARV